MLRRQQDYLERCAHPPPKKPLAPQRPSLPSKYGCGSEDGLLSSLPDFPSISSEHYEVLPFEVKHIFASSTAFLS